MYSLCLGNISIGFVNDNVKKSGLNGYIYIYIYKFSVSFETLDIIWDHFVMVNTNSELHSTKSELRFHASLNPVHDMLQICDSENL